MSTYIIEHMEPRVYPWCIIEYKHISKIVGKKNLIFTNTSNVKLKKLGKVTKKHVEKLNLDKPCLLDPNAPKKLTPKEAKKFKTFVFGGILGDYPPRKRTKDLVFKMRKAAIRNLGKEQMSTDTAVLVTKKIVDGKSLEQIPFTDNVEIHVRKGEAIRLPYRYVVYKANPVLAPGLLQFLRKQKGF